MTMCDLDRQVVTEEERVAGERPVVVTVGNIDVVRESTEVRVEGSPSSSSEEEIESAGSPQARSHRIAVGLGRGSPLSSPRR